MVVTKNIVTRAIAKAAKDHCSLSNVARICCVNRVAIFRWHALGRFPRTDFTGETNYSQTISDLSGVDRDKLLSASSRWWIKHSKEMKE